MNSKAKDRQTNRYMRFALVWLGVVLVAGGCKTGVDMSELRLDRREQQGMVERMCSALLADETLWSKNKKAIVIKPFRYTGPKEMLDAESLRWIASEIGTCLRRSGKFDVVNGAVATATASTYVLDGELSCRQDGNSGMYCLKLRIVNVSDGQAYWCDSVEMRKDVRD